MCFLLLRSVWVFALMAGFHVMDGIGYFAARVDPPCPSRFLPKFSIRKEHEL